MFTTQKILSLFHACMCVLLGVKKRLPSCFTSLKQMRSYKRISMCDMNVPYGKRYDTVVHL